MFPGRYRRILPLFVLPALLLACSLGQSTVETAPRTAVSQEAADSLEQKLQEAFALPDGETFSLEMTDAELTSYIVLHLAEQVDRRQDIPLEDFQVQFADGQMLLSGKLTSVCPFSLNVQVAASAQVDDGQLDVSVDSARLGVLPLPKALLNELSRIVSESILESPEHLETSVQLSQVEIDQGIMRLSGRMIKNAP
ncbi:MAG: hypothetical protein ACOYZ7_15140 [Chloroflexota bacterium]